MAEVDEIWDDEPTDAHPYVDGAWGRTANPNTADGELQNIAAFAHGLTRLRGWQRIGAQVVVWLVLAAIALGLLAAVVGIVLDR
jgi:hypothetical protein